MPFDAPAGSPVVDRFGGSWPNAYAKIARWSPDVDTNTMTVVMNIWGRKAFARKAFEVGNDPVLQKSYTFDGSTYAGFAVETNNTRIGDLLAAIEAAIKASDPFFANWTNAT